MGCLKILGIKKDSVMYDKLENDKIKLKRMVNDCLLDEYEKGEEFI